MKRATFHDKHGEYFNFEKSRLEEFKELCWKEHKTVSCKLNEMLVEELQKNQVGAVSGPKEIDPLNLNKHRASNKRSHHKELDPLQYDLTSWLPRDQAIKMAKTMNLNSNQWSHLGETFKLISLKKRTGYL